jgi:AGZA family xanthine/uracil permease-like MFS transporter
MRLKWFYAGDLDGFFGLFVDNLLQLMLIQVLCTAVCGLPADFVAGRILPGAAISILLGNAYYAWQAKRLAESQGRPFTTALPFGINTVSLFAHIFLIMAPVWRETQNWDLAWKAGLFACLGSAVIETLGAFFGDWLRRHTPRAALLTALAGIALTFISMGFVFQIFASPLLAVLPAFFILFVYSSRVKLPGGLPGGFVAVLLGTALAWGLRALGFDLFHPDVTPLALGLRLPQSSVSELFDFIANQGGWKYLGIILPMGLFNVIGSLQNLESAEAAGDRFPTRPSLLVNGAATFLAVALGSPFPTTIYIGHPGWKAMGARWGYSLANGAVITLLCLAGGVGLLLRWVPLEAMIGILLWIGIIIGAQAYRDVPRLHFLGVAFGFIPTLAAWLMLNMETALRVGGLDWMKAAPLFAAQGFFVAGVFALNQGFIISSMVFAAMLVYATERQWLRVAAWSLAASLLSFFGVIHAYTLTPLGVEAHFGWAAAPEFAAAYLAVAGLALLLKQLARAEGGPEGGRRFFDKKSAQFEKKLRSASGGEATGVQPPQREARRRRRR